MACGGEGGQNVKVCSDRTNRTASRPKPHRAIIAICAAPIRIAHRLPAYQFNLMEMASVRRLASQGLLGSGFDGLAEAVRAMTAM